MEDKLIQLLETFNYDVIRQGSLSDDDKYPDNFFTYWGNSSDDGSHYDNGAVSTVHDYSVNFYSNSPANTYDVLRQAITLLKSNGFIISGDGYDVPSDEDSHTGRGVNALYLEMED